MNPSIPSPSARPPNRTQFILLAMLFFFPLIGSAVLYFAFPEMRPSGTTNYGTLIAPALPAPEDLAFVDGEGAAKDVKFLRGRWSYVTLAGIDCDAMCEQHLLLTRQVRTATNAERERIQRVLVLTDPAQVAPVSARLAKLHPDLKVIADVGPAGHRLSDFLVQSPVVAHLMDPNGNWLMAYPAGRETQADFKGMQKDIKKLLSLSQIG